MGYYLEKIKTIYSRIYFSDNGWKIGYNFSPIGVSLNSEKYILGTFPSLVSPI
jgi:hypothetical protein